MHGSFYRTQLVFVLVWWLVVRLTTGRHLHALADSSVLTRPSWLPVGVLLWMHEQRKLLFAGLPLALALGAIAPGSTSVRALVAAAVSAYHLTETSATNRHGEYPILWNAWVMLLPAEHAHAGLWGVAIHFVLASGVAKCWVGGWGWLQPQTMAFYLDVVRGGPGSNGRRGRPTPHAGPVALEASTHPRTDPRGAQPHLDRARTACAAVTPPPVPLPPGSTEPRAPGRLSAAASTVFSQVGPN